MKVRRSEQEFIKNGQLSWNRIYDANINNNINGLSSAYVLYEDRSDNTQISANTMLRTKLMTTYQYLHHCNVEFLILEILLK